MTSPTEMKIFGDKTKCLEAYDVLCKNFDVKIKPVSARLTEVVLLRTFEASRGQNILNENNVPVTINDSNFALHLTKKGINKSVALLDALTFLEVKPEQTAVIGDSETDLPMFALCAYSAAVGNAPQAVKSMASYVCKEEIGAGSVEAVSHIMNEFGRH